MGSEFKFPFQKATGSIGYFEMTDSEVESASQNIKCLLITNWGERVMNYTFGCNLIEFVFEQRSDELKEKISERILSQIEKWIPYVDILRMNILFPEDDISIGLNDNEIFIDIWFLLIDSPDKIVSNVSTVIPA